MELMEGGDLAKDSIAVRSRELSQSLVRQISLGIDSIWRPLDRTTLVPHELVLAASFLCWANRWQLLFWFSADSSVCGSLVLQSIGCSRVAHLSHLSNSQ